MKIKNALTYIVSKAFYTYALEFSKIPQKTFWVKGDVT